MLRFATKVSELPQTKCANLIVYACACYYDLCGHSAQKSKIQYNMANLEKSMNHCHVFWHAWHNGYKSFWKEYSFYFHTPVVFSFEAFYLQLKTEEILKKKKSAKQTFFAESKRQRPNLPGTFHILIGTFPYSIIRFYYRAMK